MLNESLLILAMLAAPFLIVGLIELAAKGRD